MNPIVLDETAAFRAAEEEAAARRRRVALMLPQTGYRRMGRRSKRELRDLRLVHEPGLRELREKEQARRRRRRADRGTPITNMVITSGPREDFPGPGPMSPGMAAVLAKHEPKVLDRIAARGVRR